jgi:hypothetical protein
LLNRQIGEELFDFSTVQLLGMSFMVKEDEAFDPVEVGLFGADRVVFGPQDGADLIE